MCKLCELSQSSCTTKARYKELCSKIKKNKKSSEPQQLPLLYYMKTLNYITAAIQKSLIPIPVIPSVCEDYGSIIKNALFQIQWMLRKLVPDELF